MKLLRCHLDNDALRVASREPSPVASEGLVERLQAEVAKLTKERDEARVEKADLVYMAKLIKRLRGKFINIADHVQDEGDRTYFGSTNHADEFKEGVQSLDDANWSLILDKAKGRDLYAEMRSLRSALAKSEAAREEDRAEAREVIEPFAAEANRRPWLGCGRDEGLVDDYPIGGSAVTNGHLRAARTWLDKNGEAK